MTEHSGVVGSSIRLLASLGLWAALTGVAVTSRAESRARVLFSPGSPDIGPFPTDALTVADAAQRTGRRIALPGPDCRIRPSACADVTILNQYDGFSLLPRLRVRFSAPVDVETLREGIFFIALDDLPGAGSGRHAPGAIVRVDKLVYEPATNAAHGEPSAVLDQHRRYALVVTDAVRDRAGNPVAPAAEFTRCLADRPSQYCRQLASNVRRLKKERPVGKERVVGASVFTTLSATTWLEKARAVLPEFPARVEPARPKALFDVARLASMVFHRQTRANPAQFEDSSVRIDLLEGVGRIAFASYRSPSFLDAQHRIAPAPTGGPAPRPTETNELFFHVFLPDRPKPAGGYPVVLGGHGATAHRFGCVFANGLPGSLGREGLALVAVNAVGHGFGPQGTILLTEKDGTVSDLPAGGRGVDLNRDGLIDPTEGCMIADSAGSRDCLRQTALDLMQLVRAVEAGLDLDGDGSSDLDREQIQYFGHSFAVAYGTLLTAVEPKVRAAALNVGGGTSVEVGRWALDRTALKRTLGSRTPSALNRGDDFDDEGVLSGRPVKVIEVGGALEVQDVLETMEWIRMPGDPMAYAPHLRASPLPGVPAKRALFLFARGDEAIPNPTTTALVRAAAMEPWSVLYRHDLARIEAPDLPTNPHAFEEGFGSAAAATIARASQRLSARFLASSGQCAPVEPCLPDANAWLRPLFVKDLFERAPVLPEDLGYPRE